MGQKYAIVTGGNGGIGQETCRVLYMQNFNVIIAARNLKKAEAAKAAILESVKESKGSLEIIKLDLSSLESVRTFAAEIIEKWECIDYLIENAGIMALPQWKASADGYEMQFAVNHLGHWYLTQLLTPLIIKSKTRIICVSSMAALAVTYDIFSQNLIDKGFENKDGPASEDYDSGINYCISKACNVLFARELARRYGPDGVKACSLHPGAIMGTNLADNMEMSIGALWASRHYMTFSFALDNNKSIEQGAATQVRCVSLPDDEFQQGHYYWNCRSGDDAEKLDGAIIHSDMSKDSLEQKLWALSELLVKEKGFELTL